MNYLIYGTTSLRYFIPLIIESKKNGIHNHKIFLGKSGKYNCPVTNYKNYLEIKNIASQLKICLYKDEEISKYSGLTFMIEGDGLHLLGKHHIKVSMTYMTDFRALYNKYIDKCDYVIFPSKKFASYYNCLSKKNIYLGSTKYDYDFTKENNLPESLKTNNQVLVIYPRYRDLKKINFSSLISEVKSLGYKPVIKYRMKEPIKEKYDCDSIHDFYWYPHTTLDLINQSKFVINTGSTTIKESILLKKPIISLNIKPEIHLPFLTGYNFEEKIDINKKFYLKNHIDNLLSRQSIYEFDKCISENLFIPGETSKKILKFFNKI